MVPVIHTALDLHGVRTPEDYRAAHAGAIANLVGRGRRVAVHESADPLVARIDHNRWIVDCECGAGNATDPEWAIACCFGCGAVHAQIVFPDAAERAAIERALLARPRPETRHWDPRVGETLADLWRENAEHGVKGGQ